MEPSKRSLSRLESMPDDMLRLIVSKVGASSSADYCNTMMACKSLNFGLADPLIAKTLNITPMVERPNISYGYGKMMESLLASNNLDAHYVKGMCEYFDLGNPDLGLYHLRIASKGAHKEAKYLYGVLLMATGMISKGKKILSKLTEDIGLDSVETSWENVQASLSHLTVEMKEVYVDSLISMEPELNCHPPGVNTVCYKCYHAYLMTEFFEMALGLNPAPAAA
ncbi:F-box protein At2g35280-like [Brassica napus]|uniref:F-box protein At2g35280-like n=1 Tax=Brassica napus TaxID=3708 RepID=UPI0006AABBA6|nr:F-box protein At2g35280-like [Brassica napus]